MRRFVLHWALPLGLLGCPGADDTDDFGDGTAGSGVDESVTGTSAAPSTSSAGPGSATGGSSDDTTGALILDVGFGTTSGGPAICDAEDPVIAAMPCDDITIEPPFDDFYRCRDFGQVPGVPSEAGGVTFTLQDPDLLLIGGRANHPQGRLYAIQVTRDPQCHVNGFAEATATEVAIAAYNDGGVAFGPDQVLFAAKWPRNELAQYLWPTDAPSVEIDLVPFGVGPDAIAGLAFVPPMFMGENQLKIVTWETGNWFTLELAPDGLSTFEVLSATAGPTLEGGPEGFVYVSDDNAGIDAESILVAEWSADNVALYEVDDDGDPVVNTRIDFITGLTGALGAHIDYTAGDFLFSTFGGGDRLIAIRGFLPNPRPEG